MSSYFGGKFSREKSWLVNQLPSELLTLISDCDAFIAGGAVTSAFSNKKVRDLDVFFRSKSKREVFLAVLSNLSSDSAIEIETDYDYKELKENIQGEIHFLERTETALTYSWEYKGQEFFIQAILLNHVVGEPEGVLSQFDFTISEGAYLPREESFVLNEDFLRDLSQRRLIYTGSDYPMATLLRIVKFVDRGFTISGVDLVRVGLAINNLTLSTLDDYLDQLNGIDIALFKPLIEKVKEDMAGETRVPAMAFDEAIVDYLNAQFEYDGEFGEAPEGIQAFFDSLS